MITISMDEIVSHGEGTQKTKWMDNMNPRVLKHFNICLTMEECGLHFLLQAEN